MTLAWSARTEKDGGRDFRTTVEVRARQGLPGPPSAAVELVGGGRRPPAAEREASHRGARSVAPRGAAGRLSASPGSRIPRRGMAINGLRAGRDVRRGVRTE